MIGDTRAALSIFGVVLLFAIISSMMNSPVRAGGLPDTYIQCINSRSTNFGWDECGAQEINRQEDRLNAVWKKTMTCMAAPDYAAARTELIAEERLWIKFKDASCRFYGAPDSYGSPTLGREGIVLSAPSCKAEIIKERAHFLEGVTEDFCRK